MKLARCSVCAVCGSAVALGGGSPQHSDTLSTCPISATAIKHIDKDIRGLSLWKCTAAQKQPNTVCDMLDAVVHANTE